MFMVIENTPGYLPEDDDPAVFDSVDEAREYATEQLDRLIDHIAEGQDFDDDANGWTVIGDFAEGDLSVVVYDGARSHDLGRVIEIVLVCPVCREAVWDGPQGHKLAKCWNSEGHPSGMPLAFDTMA